jgi:L-threonylcarbamoyladenylate synthase
MSKQDLNKAFSALSNGELIVYPTDTIYGLGANVFDKKAVKKLFEIKKRPFNLPISIAVSCVEDIGKIAFTDEKARKIADIFLPGSLTLVLKKKKIIPDIITSGLDKVGIRIPDNKIAIDLLSNFGPLTCTSANIHGCKTPSVISDIIMQFKPKDISVYIDDGKLEGKPSTIVDLTSEKPRILRQGTISEKQIMDAIDNG